EVSLLAARHRARQLADALDHVSVSLARVLEPFEGARLERAAVRRRPLLGRLARLHAGQRRLDLRLEVLAVLRLLSQERGELALHALERGITLAVERELGAD